MIKKILFVFLLLLFSLVAVSAENECTDTDFFESNSVHETEVDTLILTVETGIVNYSIAEIEIDGESAFLAIGDSHEFEFGTLKILDLIVDTSGLYNNVTEVCFNLYNYCYDSDSGADSSKSGYISGYDSKGNDFFYADSCYENGLLKEFICTIDSDSQFGEVYDFEIIECALGCEKNICLQNSDKVVNSIDNHGSCVDSDGGKDYFTLGKTYLSNSPDQYYEDMCLSSKLNEYYCNENGEILSYTKICEFGCMAGSCNEVDLTCVDSDKGIEKYEFGYAYYDQKIESTLVIDKCDDNKKLREYECIDNQIITSYRICEFGCENGACKETASDINDLITREDVVNNVHLLIDAVNEIVESFPDVNVDVNIELPELNISGTTSALDELTQNVDISSEEKSNSTIKEWCADGCIFNDNCVIYGTRKSGKFCDSDGELKTQFITGNSCENAYQCLSNVCIDNVCITNNIVQKFFAWFRDLFD